MITKFYSDSGRPCWRCSATLHEYTVDDGVTYIDVKCYTCYACDMFYPGNSRDPVLDTAAKVSAAHRAVS